jgi:hypothetical protein
MKFHRREDRKNGKGSVFNYETLIGSLIVKKYRGKGFVRAGVTRSDISLD